MLSTYTHGATTSRSCHLSPISVFAIVVLFMAVCRPSAAAAPINDDFADATVISGDSGSESGTNVDATIEAGEPDDVDGFTPKKSIWWKWTAPSDMEVTFGTCGTSFNTLMGVYSGAALPFQPNEIVGENERSCGSQSEVTFSAQSGTVYYILTGALYSSDSGAIALGWSPVVHPDNDDYANATVITGVSGTSMQNNQFATTEPGGPAKIDGETVYRSVWWKWTAPSDMVVTFDTCDSYFDTKMGAYSADSLPLKEGDILGENRNGCGSQSRLTFYANTGVTYHIMVDGEGADDFADITLTWKAETTTPPANDEFANAAEISGDSGIANGTNVDATRGLHEPDHIDGQQGYASVWWKVDGTGERNDCIRYDPV